MDVFKTAEVKRMEFGGNKPWKTFFNSHPSNRTLARDFDGCTIAERYDSEAGEEWKERLTAKVDGTEYVPGSSRRVERPKREETSAGSGRNTPSSISNPLPQRPTSPTQKARNEAYFASKGSENAARPSTLPPNQGGKYSGFGSGPPSPTSSTSSPGNAPAAVPTAEDFQNDPVAALSKSFGWLSSTVSKQAATLNSAYIQPGIKNLNETDFAAQARAAAVQAGSLAQQGARGVNEQFTRFVDPDAGTPGTSSSASARGVGGAEPEKKDFWDSFGQAPAGPPRERREFWDDFSAAGEAKVQQGNKGSTASIGTSAMKTNAPAAGGAVGKREEEGWGGW